VSDTRFISGGIRQILTVVSIVRQNIRAIMTTAIISLLPFRTRITITLQLSTSIVNPRCRSEERMKIFCQSMVLRTLKCMMDSGYLRLLLTVLFGYVEYDIMEYKAV
jgi:hypothetical protein